MHTINQVADIGTTVTFPSMRGVLLVIAPWILSIRPAEASFFSLHWWEIVQYILGIAVALFGLYDFYLKIKWKRRREKDVRSRKQEAGGKEQNEKQ